jgi:TetR/AcrR family transcriptional regulator
MGNEQTILKVGLKLFADRGYDAVGIQEIVDTAGITKPTLYHYFGNKEGLLDAIFNDNFSNLLTALEKATQYQGNITSSLELIASTFFEFAASHPNFYRFQLACWFAPSQSAAFKAVDKYAPQQHRLMEEFFQQAAHDHGNMRGRQQQYAASFLGLINTYIGYSLKDYLELGESVVRTTVNQFMHGIFS